MTGWLWRYRCGMRLACREGRPNAYRRDGRAGRPPCRLKARAVLEGHGIATAPPGEMLELPPKARLPGWPSGHSNSVKALTRNRKDICQRGQS